MILKKYFLVALLLALISSAWAQIPVADLGVPVKEPISVYEMYKSESHQRMNEYEKSMDVFYMKLSREKQKIQSKNETKLVNLEKKAASLRVRIESFKPEERKDWLTFKFTTSRAIDAFAKDVSDLKIDM